MVATHMTFKCIPMYFFITTLLCYFTNLHIIYITNYLACYFVFLLQVDSFYVRHEYSTHSVSSSILLVWLYCQITLNVCTFSQRLIIKRVTSLKVVNSPFNRKRGWHTSATCVWWANILWKSPTRKKGYREDAVLLLSSCCRKKKNRVHRFAIRGNA